MDEPELSAESQTDRRRTRCNEREVTDTHDSNAKVGSMIAALLLVTCRPCLSSHSRGLAPQFLADRLRYMVGDQDLGQ